MVHRLKLARVVPRLAVAGLAVGLVALATLAIWGTHTTARTTERVNQMNAVIDVWGQILFAVTVEESAADDLLRADRGADRQRLANAIGSAQDELDWLVRNADEGESRSIDTFRHSYAAYGQTLRQLMDASVGSDERLEPYVEQAALAFSSVRKQATSNLGRKQLELAEYLTEVDDTNARTRMATWGVFAVDALLFTFCAGILVNYQRRIEREAAGSRHQALHDALTGLPNRVMLGQRLDEALASAQRTGKSVGLLLIDLDGFKQVNDTLGHHCGDLLLQQVADRLMSVVRTSDTVARLGGDEFAILLPDSVLSGAHDVAARVLAVLGQPVELGDRQARIGGSIGIAVYPGDGGDRQELSRYADAAMYHAKRQRLGMAAYREVFQDGPSRAGAPLAGEDQFLPGPHLPAGSNTVPLLSWPERSMPPAS
ncbi:hypothetical protein GCM10010156_21240 [Planobispora rosea]|uniref:GGDEF domain-containing protein n=1 Tax=Planobispora rosea TaxID=35762 RepID=A0A8J3WCT1_PLARO|nr:GGDEF domain-containing protein [Planobispora rosea]GGS62183.1 hypothetical protein GCM10010156_21240 [Planobispora rosea]GIH84363.1 hypothetical protein Pro02_27710 [Planobispora rosea]